MCLVIFSVHVHVHACVVMNTDACHRLQAAVVVHVPKTTLSVTVHSKYTKLVATGVI